MEITISAQPSYSIAYVRLSLNESVECETNAMVAMSLGIDVAGSVEGGVVKSAIRKVAGNETFFRSKYTAKLEGAWVALSPKFPGDISVLEVNPADRYLVQSGAILANSEGLEVSVRFSGITSMVQKEGLVMSEVSGEGKLIVSAYGAIEKMDLGPGQSLIVDTGHLVAWSESTSIKIGPLNSTATSAMTGEGLVGLVTGPGVVYMQTRSERGLRQWLFPERLDS